MNNPYEQTAQKIAQKHNAYAAKKAIATALEAAAREAFEAGYTAGHYGFPHGYKGDVTRTIEEFLAQKGGK